jgi:three-Cys-motif partner protein
MNRNVLLWNPEEASEESVARLNKYWGDESWRTAAYSNEYHLFKEMEKQPNEVVVEAFRKRLKEVAGFKYVPKPVAMKNSIGAPVYYLFFAAQEQLADKIARDIFKRTVIRSMNG